MEKKWYELILNGKIAPEKLITDDNGETFKGIIIY